MADYPPFSNEKLTLNPATPAQIPALEALIHAAYVKYTPRIGREPAPMTADYSALLTTHDVFVLQKSTSSTTAETEPILGTIVLYRDRQTNIMRINSLAVDPAAQGGGYGRVLLQYTEQAARTQGFAALELYTNVKMIENLGFYGKLGFVEMRRGVEDGYERVYFRKEL